MAINALRAYCRLMADSAIVFPMGDSSLGAAWMRSSLITSAMCSSSCAFASNSSIEYVFSFVRLAIFQTPLEVWSRSHWPYLSRAKPASTPFGRRPCRHKGKRQPIVCLKNHAQRHQVHTPCGMLMYDAMLCAAAWTVMMEYISKSTHSLCFGAKTGTIYYLLYFQLP